LISLTVIQYRLYNEIAQIAGLDNGWLDTYRSVIVYVTKLITHSVSESKTAAAITAAGKENYSVLQRARSHQRHAVLLLSPYSSTKARQYCETAIQSFYVL